MKNFRNTVLDYDYIYKGIIVDAEEKTKLQCESCKNHQGRVYLYYKRESDNKRINQNYVDETIGVYVDQWISKKVVKLYDKHLTKSKEKEYQSKVISKLCDSGIIDVKYAKNVMLSLQQGQLKSIDQLKELKRKIQEWDRMSDRERKQFIVQYVESIEVDIECRQVCKVNFYDSNPFTKEFHNSSKIFNLKT